MKKVFVMGYETRNIGDEIQTIATTDILNDLKIQYDYVERDRISSYQFKPQDHNIVIMNGWFTNGYGLDAYYSTRQDMRDQIKITWPPTGYFTPLAYSFCLSQWGEDRHTPKAFTSEDAINFYKTSPGFGCRDQHTYDEISKLGVSSAYVSKCLTLTLDPIKYRKENAQRDLVFVDVPDSLRDTFIKVAPKYLKEYNVKTYTHELYDEMDGCFDRVKYAKKLLEKYANAALVITSRLHVALPCLAFGTPCIFWNDKNNSRYDDYLEYMYTIGFGKDLTFEDYSNLVEKVINEPKKWSDVQVKDNFIKSIKYVISDDFIFDEWCTKNSFLKISDDTWSRGSHVLSKWENGVQIDWYSIVGGAKYIRKSKFSTCGEFQRAWESHTWNSEWAESKFIEDVQNPKTLVRSFPITIKSKYAQLFYDMWDRITKKNGSALGQLEPDSDYDLINFKNVSHVVKDVSVDGEQITCVVEFLETIKGNIALEIFTMNEAHFSLEFFVNPQTLSLDLRLCNTK